MAINRSPATGLASVVYRIGFVSRLLQVELLLFQQPVRNIDALVRVIVTCFNAFLKRKSCTGATIAQRHRLKSFAMATTIITVSCDEMRIQATVEKKVPDTTGVKV